MGLLSITEMWYTKKIRYRRSTFRAKIEEDGAGIALRQMNGRFKWGSFNQNLITCRIEER